MRCVCCFAFWIFLCAGSVIAGETDRQAIVARMNEFLSVQLTTNVRGDSNCLEGNLRNSHLEVADPKSSDIFRHVDFLHGRFASYSWSGMPYAYGNSYTPEDDIQGAINQCRSLGNHDKHYALNGCDCSWSVGTDCSAAVSYAGHISRRNTCDLADTTSGVSLTWDGVKAASYVCKCGVHVVLVESRSGTSVTVLEATGSYPVSRSIVKQQQSLSGYSYWDFKDVANDQGSDGVLIARRSGGAVDLTWSVESAQNARWYEFQYLNETEGVWVTFDEQDFRGPGDYLSSYGGAGAESLVFRVRENEWGGCRIPQSETRAFATN